MMTRKRKRAFRDDGRRCVSLANDKYDHDKLCLSFVSIGWQTKVVRLDEEMLEWLADVIKEFRSEP